MHKPVRLGLITLALCASLACHAQDSLPPPLRDWQGWVLKGEEFRRCPFLASATPQPGPLMWVSEYPVIDESP